jgi:hypothetical protein
VLFVLAESREAAGDRGYGLTAAYRVNLVCSGGRPSFLRDVPGHGPAPRQGGRGVPSRRRPSPWIVERRTPSNARPRSSIDSLRLDFWLNGRRAPGLTSEALAGGSSRADVVVTAIGSGTCRTESRVETADAAWWQEQQECFRSPS